MFVQLDTIEIIIGNQTWILVKVKKVQDTSDSHQHIMIQYVFRIKYI